MDWKNKIYLASLKELLEHKQSLWKLFLWLVVVDNFERYGVPVVNDIAILLNLFGKEYYQITRSTCCSRRLFNYPTAGRLEIVRFGYEVSQ